jgi:hypothetical protein
MARALIITGLRPLTRDLTAPAAWASMIDEEVISETI